MEIDLYTISDHNNTLDREIGEPTKINGTLRDGSFSLLTPQFLLKNPSDGRVFKYNYLYSPDFNRYYFIIDYSIQNNGLLLVQCKVDVLKSYVDLIKKSSGLVDRGVLSRNGYPTTTPYFYNTQYVDEGYSTLVLKEIDSKKISWDYSSITPIKNGKFILLGNRGD